MRKSTLPLILSTIFALGACTDPVAPTPTPPDRGEPTNIKFNISQLAQTTRAEIETDLIKTEWTAGDKASVYVLFKENLDAAGEYAIASAEAISEDRTSAEFTGEWKWRAAALPHTFYAYAPKTALPPTTGEDGQPVQADADPKAVPIALPAAQTQDGTTSQFLSRNNFWIATPREKTAPRDFTDPTLDSKVALEMKSAFSILEFRFASWEDDDAEKKVIIKKLTLTSNKRPLALTKGTIDITKPAYATDFGVITADEANLTSTVTLDIANGGDVPKSERKTVILGNRSKEPFDGDKVFPARVLVMPNRSIPIGQDEQEQWSLKIEYTIDGKAQATTREFATSRPLRAGERHAIAVVLVTAEGEINPPPPEQPGAAWDGTSKAQPVIDAATKTITIATPAELAWLADAVNGQTVETAESPRLYDGYTIKFTQNINLGDKPWTPIGHDPQKSFHGSIDGGDADVDEDGIPDGVLITGLNVSPTEAFSSEQTEALGLFGRVAQPTTGTATIRNIRVKGKINFPNIYFGRYPHAGGVVGVSARVPISGCDFEGTITGITPLLGRIGGIVAQTNANVTDCHSAAEITVTSNGNINTNFGGVVGQSQGGTIRACGFTGSIRVLTGDASVGGIVGESNAYITACKNAGTLNGDSAQEMAIGGIAGVQVTGDVRSCYNTGAITVNGAYANVKGSAGGITGAIYSSGARIMGCYSRGKVTASRQYTQYAGNIFGRAESTLGYNYSNLAYNYFLYTPLFSDQRNELSMTAVMQFSTAHWPQVSYPDWGIGDGSANNKYWNEIFPDTYGTEEWEYPQLYWEVIE